MSTLRTSILCVQLVGWKSSFCIHLCEREALVQGADKLLKLYYTWHRHDGLQKSLRNLGSMPASYLQHEIQMKLCRQGSHTFHAGFYMHNLPSRCKALVHHTLHDSVSNLILQFASGCSMEICTQILMFSHASSVATSPSGPLFGGGIEQMHSCI